MNYHTYTDPQKFYQDAKAEGYNPTTTMMHGITQTMQKLEIPLPAAISFLLKTRILIVKGKNFYFNLNYQHLLNLPQNQRALLENIIETLDHIEHQEENKQALNINWQISETYNYLKEPITNIQTTKEQSSETILITQDQKPTITQNPPKYAITIDQSNNTKETSSHISLYILKENQYHHIPSRQLPNKKYAEWVTQKTGKPTEETYLQGLYILTEIENFTPEEAKKIMQEAWEKED